MNNKFKSLLIKKILPNYLEKFSDVAVFKEKYVFPDKYIRILEIDNEKFCILYADYLDNDLDFNNDILIKAGIKVKRYLPLIDNQDKYSLYFENDICDNCFVLVKIY